MGLEMLEKVKGGERHRRAKPRAVQGIGDEMV
jgi:hypothetical protein